MQRKYNCIRGIKVKRDWLYSEHCMTMQLPSSVDLRNMCSPVVDQKQIGSCTGNALAGAYEFIELKALRF